jgi:hypothetical protein
MVTGANIFIGDGTDPVKLRESRDITAARKATDVMKKMSPLRDAHRAGGTLGDRPD